MNKEEVFKIVLENKKIQEDISSGNIIKIILGGSRAIAFENANSDWDIIIFYKHKKTTIPWEIIKDQQIQYFYQSLENNYNLHITYFLETISPENIIYGKKEENKTLKECLLLSWDQRIHRFKIEDNIIKEFFIDKKLYWVIAIYTLIKTKEMNREKIIKYRDFSKKFIVGWNKEEEWLNIFNEIYSYVKDLETTYV